MQAVFGVRWGRLFWVLVCLSVVPAHRALAFGEASGVELVSLDVGKGIERARSVTERLAWEVRKRSSVEPILEPGKARLGQASLFRSPFLYWRGSDEFPPLSDEEIESLRKYVHRGGFILIDDATAKLCAEKGVVIHRAVAEVAGVLDSGEPAALLVGGGACRGL